MSDTILADSRWRIADSVWYHQPSPPGHLLSLAIADLRVELRCNDRGLADQLRTRYHQYLASGTPHLTADVHWSGRSHAGYLADASMTFADGSLHLAAPGYDGAVDVKRGRARLQLSSTDPASDVEYFLRVCIALLACGWSCAATTAGWIAAEYSGSAGPFGPGAEGVGESSPRKARSHRVERTKSSGLQIQPRRGFVLSARGFSPAQ